MCSNHLSEQCKWEMKVSKTYLKSCIEHNRNRSLNNKSLVEPKHEFKKSAKI